MDTQKLLNTQAVIDLTSLSRATIERKEKDGSFPKAIRISSRRRAWRERDIIAFINEAAA